MDRDKDVGSDPHMTLDDWLLFISMLIQTYGGQSVLYTDAGYNNVTLLVTPAGD